MVLTSGGQYDTRKLRIDCAIATPARNWSQCEKHCPLHRQGWRTENDHIAELTRSDGELQWKRHSLAVCIPESRQAVEGLDHVREPLAGCDLHPYPRVSVRRIPPVMP